MEFDLHPSIAIRSGSFSMVIAPVPVMTQALNTCTALQRYLTLYSCGNYSRVLSEVHRTCSGFTIQRAFTAYQLITILREAYHTIVLVEHDGSLYENDRKMVYPVAMALREAARTAAVVCYTPVQDGASRRIAEQADRVFIIEAPSPAPQRPGLSHSQRAHRCAQKTLDAFSGMQDGRR
jgi:DNA polymerase I